MINNRDELNSYYSKINTIIDEYLNEWNLSPIRLKKYLKGNKINVFLKKYDLPNNKSIIRIIDDVIDDRISIMNDNVSESNDVFKGINNIDSIDIMKRLADLFDTNLSSIEVIDDAELNKYKVNTWDGIKTVYTFTLDDFKKIRSNIISDVSNKIKNKKLAIFDLDLDLENIINYDNLKSILLKSINIEYINNYISTNLKCKLLEKNKELIVFIKE